MDAKKAGRSRLGPAIGALAAGGLAAVAYVLLNATGRPAADPSLEDFARGSLKRLQVSAERPPAPTTPVLDALGQPVRLADLPGEVVVVNLWSTTCPPCIVEMPTLAALQRAYPGRVEVATVSLDPVGRLDRARAFLAENAPLEFRHDPTFAVAFAMEARGLPATVVYVDGRERARVLGAAEWDSPEARGLIDALLAES